MAPPTAGLHHVTAIAGDPQRNADFYVGTLGLRFVKRTVNHDDTGTYHFYFGDNRGTPGTNITFFPWTDDGRQGQFGAGQTRDTAYLISPDSVDYWLDRLADHCVDVEEDDRFGETVLRFADPDGIGLELVASADAADSPADPWPDSDVPAEHQLRGFHSATLAVAEVDPTAEILTGVLGYEREAEIEEDGKRRVRFRTQDGGPGSVVDLVETDAGRGQMGVGTVHHVAFTAESVADQEQYIEAYAEHGLEATDPIDRKYFTAIYCREPGGVLFEIATTGPGFAADESVDDLGSRLTLPEWLEDERAEIEASLAEFDPDAVPGADR
ncbi:ring-cleaving dioxygenase [Salinirubrum litoreum]|uniref:Ring-cleaving dioxygenase n=1 Tax=Salinirubrum litoreum TaxID=1126234 RepID=A0ABD5RDQ8_9EURY|nr:ring-cleaving dioxygenase [Salinirubrum litoreum]